MGKRKDDILLKRIGLRIKQLREQRNITQEVFYIDTGINIGRIERGKRNIGIITLNLICNYLEIDFEKLFDNFNSDEPSTKENTL